MPSGAGHSPSRTFPSMSMRMTCSTRNSLHRRYHGIAEERAIRLAVGDVAGDVVVVTLAPQGTGQQHQFLPGAEVGDQLLSGRRKRHRAS